MTKLTRKQLQALETLGVDTSNFGCNFGDVSINININGMVEDVQLKHYTFRRFVMAQTLKMLNHYDGWDGALAEKDYMYQFHVIEDEVKALAKMEKEKGIDYWDRRLFFTPQVIQDTYKDYINKLNKYIEKNQYIEESTKKKCGVEIVIRTPMVKLEKNFSGQKVYDVEFLRGEINRLKYKIECLNLDKNYAELLSNVTRLNRGLIFLPFSTPKYEEWKQAFRGAGAYYTLQNMISYHGVKVLYGDYGFPIINSSIDSNLNELRLLLLANKREVWKLHYFMKKVIKDNKFDTYMFNKKK